MDEIEVNGIRFRLDLSQPLYEQVLNQVRSSIAKGEIQLGAKMPSIRELAQALKINPNTVMRSYQELERDGLTETRRGQGTFITSNSEVVEEVRIKLAHEAISEFVDKMSSLGFSLKDVQNLIVEQRGDLE